MKETSPLTVLLCGNMVMPIQKVKKELDIIKIWSQLKYGGGFDGKGN